VACIIVTSVSRPDHPRRDSINFSLWRRGRCRHPHALAGTIQRNEHHDDRARGRFQNPLAQNDVRAGEPNRR